MSGRILLLFCVVCMLQSCTDVLDLDPRAQRVVVYGILENTMKQVVELRYTSYLSEDYMPPVENARVWVEEENRNDPVAIKYNFKELGNGYYESNFTPKFGSRYHLEIELQDGRRLSGTTLFPAQENLLNLRPAGYAYSFRTAYIPLYLWIYGMDYSDKLGKEQVANYIYGSRRYLSSEEILDPFNYSDLFVKDVPEYKNRFVCEYHGDELLSQGYLRYEIGVKKIPQLYELSDFWITAVPIFTITETGLPHSKSYVVFDSVSEEYDAYLKSVILLQKSEKQDLTNLYDLENAFSNIEGGIGIFGAVYRSKLSLLWNNYQEIGYENQ